jgi:hypothetical protein
MILAGYVLTLLFLNIDYQPAFAVHTYASLAKCEAAGKADESAFGGWMGTGLYYTCTEE